MSDNDKREDIPFESKDAKARDVEVQDAEALDVEATLVEDTHDSINDAGKKNWKQSDRAVGRNHGMAPGYC